MIVSRWMVEGGGEEEEGEEGEGEEGKGGEEELLKALLRSCWTFGNVQKFQFPVSDSR